ncbi:hypothetical protein ACFQ1S_35575, partial [Kibdelosporangium lantanae]
WHSARPMQAALAEFIDEGLLARHIRRTRSEYQTRHDRIAEALRTSFSDILEPVPAAAGLHMAAYFVDDRDDIHVRRRAREAGVGLYALTPFRHSGPGRTGLVIGYGAIPSAQIAGVSAVVSLLSTKTMYLSAKRFGRVFVWQITSTECLTSGPWPGRTWTCPRWASSAGSPASTP